MQSSDFDDHLKNIGELVKKYEESLKTDFQTFFTETEIEDIIEYYLEIDEDGKAMAAADIGLAQFKYSSTFYIRKAEIFIEHNKLSEAWSLLEDAHNFSPNEIAVILLKADILTQKQQYSEAIDLVENALNFCDADEKADLWLELADIYEVWEKYYEVIDCLQECLKIDKENEEALNRIWFCVELTEKYEESITFHKQFIDENPYSYLAWFNLAHAYSGLKQYKKAIDAFEYVLAIDGDYDPALVDMADVYYKLENYHKAISFYKEAIEKGAQKKELYYFIGKCYDKLKDFQNARNAYKKCIAIDPYFARAFNKIGKNYLQVNLPKNAIGALERAVKLDAKNTEYATNLAFAHFNNGNFDLAITMYESILESNELDKNLHLHYTSALYEIGSLRDAIKHIDEMIALFNQDFSLYYFKAAFLFELGDNKEALNQLHIAYVNAPESIELMYNLMPELRNRIDVITLIEQLDEEF